MTASSWFRRASKRSLVAAVKPALAKLALNPLEDRTTPAGNVVAFVGDGILYVVGDAADNQVWVAGTGRRSAIVRPLGDTTLNGGTEGVWLGDIRGYHIEDQAGSNTVVVSGLNTRGTLNVRTGGGDDQVSILGVQVRQQTTIDTGAGNDDLRIAGSNFRGTAFVNTGAGNDTVSISDSRFLGTTAISGGTGTNTIGLDGVYFRRPLVQDGFQQVFATALPRANADAASVTAGQSVTIAVAANDTAGAGTLNLSSVVVTAGPASGTAVANPDGSVTYTAGASAVGTDTFRYTIRNSGGAVSNEATVTLTVAGSPVSPPTVPPVTPPVTPPPVDTIAPTVALASTAADPTNVSPIPFTATFDEDVTGLGAGGIVVTNGVVVGFTAVDARTYTFGVSPTGQGIVTATVSSGAARDAAGNDNAASPAVSRTFDTIAPAVTVNPLTTNSTTPTLTGTVDDPAATVSLTVGGQTVAALVSGGNYTATLPAALAEGTYTVQVTATDRAGNVGSASQANGLVIDTTAPTATVTSPAPEPTNTSPVPFTVTFSEAVTGFSAAGVAVANGTVVNFSQVDARTYTFGVSPTASGAVSVSAAAGAARDAAGNPSVLSAVVSRTFSSGTVAVTADRLTTNDPTPTLTGTVGDPAATVRVTAGGQTVTAAVSGSTWSATLPTPLAEGTYDIQVTATDAANNVGSTTQTGGLVIDLTAPTAAVTTTAPSPTNLASIPFTVTFSEPVTGFTAAGLVVTDGTAAGFTAVDARTYTVTVAPAADGVVTVAVAAGAARDAAGNPNPASAAMSVTSDRTAPAPTVSSPAADPTAVNPIPFTVAFSEDVTGFATGGVTVGNGSVAGFTVVDARTYALTVVPAATGAVSVSIAAGAANDAAGNASLASNTVTRQFTGTVVTPTVSTTAASPTNLSPIPFTVTFDRDVTGFTLADIQVTNGTAADFQAVNARTYTFGVTPAADGPVTVTVPAGAATGPDGAPTAAGSFSVVSDRTAPTASLATTAADPTNLAVVPFTLSFSEDVTEVAASDLSVTNGTLANFRGVDARTFTFDVTHAADGAVTVAVAADAGRDAAGNGSLAASFSITSDRTAPTVAVTTTADDPTDLAVIPFTATFSEGVTGFTLAGVSATNGTPSNFQAVSATTFTFDVTPIGDGPVTVTVAAGSAQDAAGNANTAGSLTVTSERFAPTATITTTAADPTNLAAIPVTVTFSEDVTGFDDTKPAVTNGTLSNFVAVSPRVYTFDLTPATDGLVTVDLPAGAARDAAGNASVAATFGITSDRTVPAAPAVAGLDPASDSGAAGDGITNVAAPTLVGMAEAGATVTVSADPGSGPVSLGTTSADAGGNWTLTPASPLADGTYAVTAVATDAAGNGSPASAAFALTIDTVAPVASVTTTATALTNLAVIPFTVTFDSDTPGFTDADLIVANGTVGSFTKVDDRTYTFDLAPAADGVVTITVAAGASTDAAGNASASVTTSVVSDRTAPAATLMTTATDPTNAAVLAFTVTFDEDVTGFDLNQVQVTNGTASGLVTVDARTFTFDVTPAADGPVGVTVAAGAATDPAGNANMASATVTVTSDRTPPTGTATAASPTNAATIVFTLGFDEDVSDLDPSALSAANGTVGAVTRVDARTFTVGVTPAADGPVTLTVAAGAVADPAGNGSAEYSGTATSDRTAPAATLATTATDPTNAAALSFTVTFDEDVGTFDLAAVQVTNGTASGLVTVDARTFTFDVTPAGDGPVGVTVGAGAASDAAGNASTASGTITVTSDRTTPTGTATAASPTATATVLFTLGFDEDVTDVDPAALSVVNGTVGAITRVDGRTFTVEVTPAADGPVTLTVAAGAVADLAGNGSTEFSGSVTSDRTAPAAAIDPDSTGAVTGTSSDATSGVAAVAVSISDGTAFWDGAAFASPTEVFLDATSADGFATWSYAFPTPGTYAVRARATDAAGNQAFAAADVTVG